MKGFKKLCKSEGPKHLKYLMKCNALTAVLLCVLLAASGFSPAYGAAVREPATPLKDVLAKTSAYLLENTKAPAVGTYGGEWTVIGLSRWGAQVPEDFYDGYYESLEKALLDNQGVLHARKYTEYSRAVVALAAMGRDPANVAGYNLLERLADFDNLVWQGINGAIWGLIALDAGGYQVPAVADIDNVTSRDKLIAHILSKEIEGGGWSMDGAAPDPDITGMALQSLAPYRDRVDVGPAVDRGVEAMSRLQNSEGSFSSWGSLNSESACQVLVALCTLGIDPQTDQRFIKGDKWIVSDIIDNYYDTKTGAFEHIKGMGTDGMATDQCFYALTAYDRFLKGQTPLYDMSDVEKNYVSAADRQPEKLKEQNTYENKFTDIDGDDEREAIVALAAKGILSGMTETEFRPELSINRAQFAAIIVNALCLDETPTDSFADVKASDWYSGYVGAAESMGIIGGYSDGTFRPKQAISRQEAAVMVARAARAAGADTAVDNAEIINTLCQFTDYVQCGQWSMEAVAFCVREGYMPDGEMEIRPNADATRSEIAGMVFRMLGK